MNNLEEVSKSFNTHAHEYDSAAVVQQEIGERLFQRLSYLKINPRYILDLGCGTGEFSQQLKKQYPNAIIVGFDLALNMLIEAKSKQANGSWFLTGGDMARLPFPSGLFDLIFANQAIHWACDMQLALRELNRVMNVDGCLMFSTLGPDTMMEIRNAWSMVDVYAHTNHFADMHDLGDVMLQEAFVDPVVDMEKITLHYYNLSAMVRALKAQGVRNTNPNRNAAMTGKKNWQQFEKAYAKYITPDEKYPLTYEVVYGHAWKGAKMQTSSGSETLISIDQIRRPNKNL